MQKWLDLLTPSAAALALLLAIALIVQTIRHGRAMRRLETRLAEREGAAARVSLDRLRQLQGRAKTSSAATATALGPNAPARTSGPRLGPIAALAAVVAVVAGTAWYVFLRDDGGDASVATTTTKTGQSTVALTRTGPPPRLNEVKTTISQTPAVLSPNKGAFTIQVLNGTTVKGAAGDGVAPVVRGFGYQTAQSSNASDQTVKESFVIYFPGKEDVADNVGFDLGIKKALPQDGYTLPPDAADVDAVVVVGEDLATKYRP